MDPSPFSEGEDGAFGSFSGSLPVCSGRYFPNNTYPSVLSFQDTGSFGKMAKNMRPLEGLFISLKAVKFHLS